MQGELNQTLTRARREQKEEVKRQEDTHGNDLQNNTKERETNNTVAQTGRSKKTQKKENQQSITTEQRQ